LREISYPEKYLSEIAHAIEAQSFSGGIVAETLEAKIVQDADRLDGLGAIGIARCFVTAGLLRRPLYSQGDAFCEHREPSDREFTLDHFYQKLLRVAETLNTNAAKTEGARRAGIMRRYLADLRCEVESLLS
ncbi:MAG: hydrolase, partial [Bdellovibrionales bacterium]|jgi:uncharacterized protein|nr:hydrolase [Bdellovibrionales bacterium]